MIKKKEKYIYLEILRIIAIFFVIFNHTGKNGFLLFSTKEIGSLSFYIYLFISIFCKFSVPIFFAISGVLLLTKDDEPLLVLWRKRILKLFISLLIISFIYYLDNINYNFDKIRLDKFFHKLFTTSGLKDHLWFLYSYIAYLISVPFLKKFVKNIDKKLFVYMIGIAIFFNGLLPIIEFLIWNDSYHVTSYLKVSWLISNIVFYPFMGYYLHNQFEIKRKKHILYLWIINIICIIISSLMTYYKITITGNLESSQIQSFFPNFILINCICIFITTKYIEKNIIIPNIIKNFILSLGSCTFGIYLIHVLIKDTEIMKSFLQIIKNTGINSMIAVNIWCICILLISYIFIFIFRKIPLIKNIL